MERKIRFFAEQINKMKIEVPINAEKLEDEDSLKLDHLEDHFEELEKELREMAKGQEQMDRNYNELIESRHVLTMDKMFFSEVSARDFVNSSSCWHRLRLQEACMQNEKTWMKKALYCTKHLTGTRPNPGQEDLGSSLV